MRLLTAGSLVQSSRGHQVWVGGRNGNCTSLLNCDTVGSYPTRPTNQTPPSFNGIKDTGLLSHGCGFDSCRGYQFFLIFDPLIEGSYEHLFLYFAKYQSVRQHNYEQYHPTQWHPHCDWQRSFRRRVVGRITWRASGRAMT